MNYFKLKQFLKTKVMLLILFIVCSLFICEKALAASWGRDCFLVSRITYSPTAKRKTNIINIKFKFFEYNLPYGVDNSYIEYLEAYYSTDNGDTFNHLMSALTENQTSKSWAWIRLKNKDSEAKINFRITSPYTKKFQTVNWGNKMSLNLHVKNKLTDLDNETWLCLDWLQSEGQKTITHISVHVKWHMPALIKSEFVDFVYDVPFKQAKLNSNSLYFSNSSPNQEIKKEDKKNTVNVYKEANAIVVKGAVREKIQVSTTSGKLLKSMVSDNDIVKIQLSVKQVYIVSIGQKTYKVALCVS